MEAKAVKRQATPRYPTRLEVLADRSLLEKHMPAAWKSWPRDGRSGDHSSDSQ